jgi:hypothetical protein
MKIFLLSILFIICFSAVIAYSDECVEGDCVNGQGTLIHPDGKKLVGEFKNGEFVQKPE